MQANHQISVLLRVALVPYKIMADVDMGHRVRQCLAA